jgi:hypothetical protein
MGKLREIRNVPQNDGLLMMIIGTYMSGQILQMKLWEFKYVMTGVMVKGL